MDIQSAAHHADVRKLENTYPRPNSDFLPIQRTATDPNAIFSFIFNKSTDLLSKRLCCYALAQLQLKGSSVNTIVEQVQSTLGDVSNIKPKIYHSLKIGYRWRDIVIWISQKSDNTLTGILVVLGTVSLCVSVNLVGRRPVAH